MFKQRLRLVQAETGSKKWKKWLLVIGRIINTTTSEALPFRVTPFEAWFGRPCPEWPEITERKERQARRLLTFSDSESESESESDSDSNEEEESDNEVFQLSELSRRIKEYTTKVAQRIIKKKGGKVTSYEPGQIVLLSIPIRMRQSTELPRILARVEKKVYKAYTLIT